MLEDVLLLDELDAAEHGLVVDGGQSGDDLHEQRVLRVGPVIVPGYDLQDVSIEIKGILEVGDLVLELVVLLTQHLLHL